MDGTREEHIRSARSAVEAHPDDLPARLRLGAALLESGDPGAALEQFAFALTQDPANLEALKGAAEAAAAAGDAARADAYRRLLHALRQITDVPAAPAAQTVEEGGSDEPGDAGIGFLRRPRLRKARRTESAAEE